MRLVGVEAGGTKFVCVLGNEKGEVIDTLHLSTETPVITISGIRDFILKHHTVAPIDAIGIGAFGPVDLDPTSKTYGFITSTPKKGWKNCNIVGMVRECINIPIGFDTDVGAAAMGEFYWGNGQGYQNFIYLTVGTGIGGGVIIDGKIQHGAMHPELGHMFIPHDSLRDPFPGSCPFHGDCLEGLAAGPAIKARWNVDSALFLPPEHVAWDLEADYLSYAMANLILTVSPERIILGGGVMKQVQLLVKIQEKTITRLAGYIANIDSDHIKNRIILAALGQEAGNIGALALARKALERN